MIIRRPSLTLFRFTSAVFSAAHEVKSSLLVLVNARYPCPQPCADIKVEIFALVVRRNSGDVIKTGDAPDKLQEPRTQRC
jgi:hypothetical protein